MIQQLCRFIREKSRETPWLRVFPASIYLFKFKRKNIRKRCEICSDLTMKTPERSQYRWILTTDTLLRWVKMHITPLFCIKVRGPITFNSIKKIKLVFFQTRNKKLVYNVTKKTLESSNLAANSIFLLFLNVHLPKIIVSARNWSIVSQINSI